MFKFSAQLPVTSDKPTDRQTDRQTTDLLQHNRTELEKQQLKAKEKCKSRWKNQSSVQFSSVQDELGKAHMRSVPSLGSFPNAAFETVPVLV